MENHGIKCDAPNCEYEDLTVKEDEYPQYLNKPCPKCGANLLTEQDYKAWLLLDKIHNSWPVKTINKIAGFFGLTKKHEVKMNGTGKVTLEVKKHD